MNYVADLAAQNTNLRYVINCSWIINGHNSAILRAIRRAIASSVLVVFAAGNDKNDADVRRIIEETCDDISQINAEFEGKIGRGRINALAALNALI